MLTNRNNEDILYKIILNATVLFLLGLSDDSLLEGNWWQACCASGDTYLTAEIHHMGDKEDGRHKY